MQKINCPACNKEISGIAAFCQHCGSSIQKLHTGVPHVEAIRMAPPPKRSVGGLLGIGIAIVPFVFSWFTLRKGHSVVERVIAFAWLAAFLVFAITNHKSATESYPVTPKPVVETILWIKSNFGDPVDKPLATSYIVNNRRFVGTFSNSAMENSPLGAYVLITMNSVDIKLYEYNRDVPLKSSVRNDCTMVLTYDGNTYLFTGTFWHDRISFSAEAYGEIIKALESNSKVEFLIRCSGHKTYQFNVPPNTNLVEIRKGTSKNLSP